MKLLSRKLGVILGAGAVVTLGLAVNAWAVVALAGIYCLHNVAEKYVDKS